ncbi:tRNA (adenosine(37)-N6)-threonylcarbamoyltransferase complex transferase subunit TsaD [Aquimarina agarilytica]|uniref:tRNA (adenosine(37)-N6)-threonylcarbamoyltransferase complex transferase subunit TsaD n=1 Tax=Aquimarina agarilytica TaxID=1087449 RepID=UPI000287D919|nr:tRNA (adenosine(37)-N6)-threonylcarbamoyltransferase complex transferase subunit TsaD [Aquimarina agarilytica]
MDTQNVYILAIESSCDDTAAAILKNDVVLANVVATQKIHEEYGGVVPELASRAHQQHIVPVVDQALKKAGITKEQLHGIAFTKGPGLMGSLLVGVSFAKSLAMSLNIPLLDVDHMQGHLLAHFIDGASIQKPTFPFLGITISGGHTQIVKITDHFEMEVIGQTIDDAIGEAFDKSAKTLGLPYPGGPLIDKYAQLGNPKAFVFSKPRVADLNFSFSGFKTAVLYFVQKQTKENPNFVQENLYDICASIQYSLTEIILDKVKKAVKQTGITTIAIGGGVSANSGIRNMLLSAEKKYNWQVHIPKFEYTTDNAAMIGIVGYFKYLKKEYADLSITASARTKF